MFKFRRSQEAAYMDRNVEKFAEIFGYLPQYIFRSPARVELGGNHTDHQRGIALCAAVDLCTKAWVSSNGSPVINIHSEGYEPFTIDMNDIEIHPEEYKTPQAIVRGTISQFVQYGLYGFDAYITSNIPAGCGLASSASFEILLATICNELSGLEKSDNELAHLAKYVENEYFGKPCGLLDQMACTAESIMCIDFSDSDYPDIWDIDFDFNEHGYSLCIIKCGDSHEQLTADYASIPADLKKICAVFGSDVLREVEEKEFYEHIGELREKCSDRAVLRAMHVYNENKRVEAMRDALRSDDVETYLSLVRKSGVSSWELAQNVVSPSKDRQDLAVALALAEKLLDGRGACRVHGGGFAGTIQAYVPNEKTEEFTAGMEALFGKGCCLFVKLKTRNMR